LPVQDAVQAARWEGGSGVRVGQDGAGWMGWGRRGGYVACWTESGCELNSFCRFGVKNVREL
jgi:hypothetical protein